MSALRDRGHPRRRVRSRPHREDVRARQRSRPDRDLSLWRYRALLPIPDDAAALPPPAPSGGLHARRRGAGPREGARPRRPSSSRTTAAIPTASFKDRASSVVVTRARWLGRSEITCSSTGNAASSLAGFAAEAGMKAFIFVPASAPEAKVAQLLVYGARVFLVEGLLRGRVPGLPGGRRGVRLVQPQLRDQPVSRRGQEDLRPRDRRADAREPARRRHGGSRATAARRRGSGRGSSR